MQSPREGCSYIGFNRIEHFGGKVPYMAPGYGFHEYVFVCVYAAGIVVVVVVVSGGVAKAVLKKMFVR